jgi:very-short-patch-repair endonuclease
VAWIGTIIIVVSVIVATILKRSVRRPASPQAWPVRSAQVLTDAEQALYWRLVQAFPDQVVLSHVQLSRILKIDAKSRYWSWYNRLSQKSVDFLVCSKELQPRIVVELDDSSHDRDRRRKVDPEKDAALRAGGIGILRFSANSLPDLDELKIALTDGNP